ncbi:porin [Ferrimonas lipolytica]|uniref:Porin n=1 Tax=Ferrimonas lipolytica TaxID=2724191 RepID=A0A6H1UDB8_9GAMM|nr:porin [Ferrimonas lipolytica]QIZ77034.1 porin [Ferrimonas lipolytica]
MSIKRTLIAAALAATVPAVATAAPVSFYGKLNVEAAFNDYDTDSIDGEDLGLSETEIRSNSSRVGVKGDLELNSDVTAFYTVEYEVNIDEEDKDNFEARNQFVGIKGNFGAISLGRQDTMLKKSQGKVDVFSDYAGDLAKYGLQGENRGTETLTYMLPKMGLFSAGVTYLAEGSEGQLDEDGERTDGFSIAAMYGDKSYKKAPFYAAIAYDTDIDEQDSVIRGSIGGKVAGIKLGALYQQQEAYGADSKDGFLVSAAYDINAWTLKTQYVDMEDTADGFSVGADYRFAKTTKAFAYYTDRSYDNELNSKSGGFAGIGLEHKF